MNKRIGPALLLIGALSATAAANADSKVRVDKADVDLGMCRTFAWQPQSGGVESLTDQRMRAAVIAAFTAKGYTEATEQPDCRIAYILSAAQTSPKSGPSVGVGVGGGSGGIGAGLGVRLPIFGKKQAVTITIDIIDATRNAQIWSGSLDGSFKSEELSEADAKKVAAKVLAEYPDRNAQPRK